MIRTLLYSNYSGPYGRYVLRQLKIMIDRSIDLYIYLSVYYFFYWYMHIRGVARIFGLGGRPCRVEPDPASTEVAKPRGSGSSPGRILLIRKPEMHFPSIWHHHHNLSNHEVQQLTFIPLLFLTLSKLQIFLQSYLLIHWQMVRQLWNTWSLPCTSDDRLKIPRQQGEAIVL